MSILIIQETGNANIKCTGFLLWPPPSCTASIGTTPRLASLLSSHAGLSASPSASPSCVASTIGQSQNPLGVASIPGGTSDSLFCFGHSNMIHLLSNVSLGWSNTTLPSPEEPLICAFYNPDFIIWSSVGSFYIPCLIMVVLYYRIFQVTAI